MSGGSFLIKYNFRDTFTRMHWIFVTTIYGPEKHVNLGQFSAYLEETEPVFNTNEKID